MKIKICSDLHLEFRNKFLELPNNTGVDVLILAGDICNGEKIHQYVPWFEYLSELYSEILMIEGNHERYSGDENTHQKIKDGLAHIKNFQLLERETRVIGDVLFIGCTLWTNLNKGCPITESVVQRSMNDYRLIRVASDDYRRLHPKDTYKIHLESVKFIRDALGKNLSSKDKCEKIVLITHHAPSLLSIHENYRDDIYMNGGYCSDLSDIFLDNPEILYAFHGHVHNHFDYKINNTRIIANPLGYPGERSDFDPDLTVEI